MCKCNTILIELLDFIQIHKFSYCVYNRGSYFEKLCFCEFWRRTSNPSSDEINKATAEKVCKRMQKCVDFSKFIINRSFF